MNHIFLPLKPFRSFLALLFVTALFLPKNSEARWATLKDASFKVNFERVWTKVHKDGSYKVLVETEVEILKDSARDDKGIQRITYNENAGPFKVLAARTMNGKRVVEVTKQNIELKPLASSGPSFDRVSQATITFPEVNVGSKLYWKYERTILHPKVPGYYSDISVAGYNEYVTSFEYHYDSEVPLYYEVKDPQKAVQVTASSQKVVFKSTAPYYKLPLEEDLAILNPSTLTWMAVSTAKNWASFPKSTGEKYDAAMAAPLPEKFEEIFKKAQTGKTAVEQINLVTSQLAEALRYVGDLRTIAGAYHPRALKTIASTGYGDCKDMTVSAGSILKKLGFDARAAFIFRGKDMIDPKFEVAAVDANHAILYAKKDNVEYWVDPTNTTSYGQGIFEDIADRAAVVLFPEGAQEKRTPPVTAADGKTGVVIDIDVVNDQIVKGRGALELLGRGASSMTAAELSSDKETLDYRLIRWMTGNIPLLRWKFAEYSLKSRIVADFKTTFEYEQQWRPVTTTAGPGHTIPALYGINYFQIRREDRVSDLNLETPLTSHQEYRIKSKEVKLAKNLECHGTSPWADYSRRIFKKSGLVTVSDDLVSKVNVVSATDIASQEFGDFQNKLMLCMKDAVVVFE